MSSNFGDVKTIMVALMLTFAVMWTTIFTQSLILFLCCTGMLCMLMGATMDRSDVKLRVWTAVLFVKSVLSQYTGSGDVKIRTSANSKVTSLAKPILKHNLLLSVQKKLSLQIQDKIAASGKAQNPRILAQQSLSYTVVSIFIFVPLSILLGFYVSPALFLLAIVPAICIGYPIVKMRLAVSERRTAIDGEMAFFTLYASVMQSVGRQLYQSIADIVGMGMFPAIEREARMLWRNIRLFGIDQQSALNAHAISHPNLHFRNLLLGYVSISKSGGDLGVYMEAKAQEFFHRTKFKHSTYRSNANIIGESMLILLTILPTLVLMSSFLLTDGSLMIMMGLSLVVIPVITILIIAITNLSQPTNYNAMTFDIRSIVVGGVASAVLLILGQHIWIVIGMGLVIGSALNFLMNFRHFQQISLTEAALSEFFRDVTEYRKIGIPIQNAIIKISESRTYNRYFDELLRNIASSLKYGHNLSDILRSTAINSWIVRTSFFMLGKIASSGGGTAQILEQMTGFSSDIHQTKKDTQASVSVISYFALASPLLMSYTSNEMLKILQHLHFGTSTIIQNAFDMQPILSGQLSDLIGLLIVVSGTSLGLVVSKLVHYTIKHTLFLAISVTISILSIVFSSYLPSLIQN